MQGKTISEQTFEQLKNLLKTQNVRFRAVKHPSAGKSEDVAKIRGTEIGQGAKALVCVVKGNGVKQLVLAVLPADFKADLQKVVHSAVQKHRLPARKKWKH